MYVQAQDQSSMEPIGQCRQSVELEHPLPSYIIHLNHSKSFTTLIAVERVEDEKRQIRLLKIASVGILSCSGVTILITGMDGSDPGLQLLSGAMVVIEAHGKAKD